MKSNLFKEIPIKILLALKNKSKLSKEINCTNSHFAKIINSFEDIGLLISEKKGRGVITRLTKKGEKIADKFILINQKIVTSPTLVYYAD